MKPLTDIKIKVSWAPGISVMGKFNFFFFILAPKGVVSQMMKDPLSLIEDKTLANEVHQVRCHKKIHSCQMSGMREGINSGRPRANFPRKIQRKTLEKITVSPNKRRKIETFTEISQRNKLVKRKTQDKAFSSIWR